MRTRKTVAAAAVALVAIVAAAGVGGTDYLRATALVIQAAGMQGMARTLAQAEVNRVDTRDLQVPWRNGSLRARLYLPRGGSNRALVLAPGVHGSGIDEPRLVQFAKDLASVRHTVLTVELDDLTRYRITPRSTDMIEDAGAWLASDPQLAPDGRIGLMGISFAGGLSIVAAGRPSIRDRVAFVLSLGGHGDLPRTLQYLCTGVQPDGSRRPPHDYGVAIILLGVADQVVPAEQVEPLRDAILVFLDASRHDLIEKARSAQLFARARELETMLPEPARTFMHYVNTRDVAHLGPLLLSHTTALGGDPTLSPTRSPFPRAPVYLLHGTDDNVIPAAESELLAYELRARNVEVEQLATPLITHAEVDRSATARAVWELIAFWKDVLDS